MEYIIAYHGRFGWFVVQPLEHYIDVHQQTFEALGPIGCISKWAGTKYKL